MKSILESIKAQLTKPDSYYDAFTSINPDTEISRKVQTKSLHVIKYTQVYQYIKSFNSNTPKDQIDRYFEILTEVRPKNVLRLNGAQDKYLIVFSSKLNLNKVNIGLITFLLDVLEAGHTTIDVSKDIQDILEGIQGYNNYQIVKNIMDSAGKKVRREFRTDATIYKFTEADLNVGHSDVSSNVSFLLNTFVSNALASSDNTDIGRLIKLLEDPNFIRSLRRKFNPNILTYIHNNQLTLVRHFSRGKGHVSLSFDGVSPKHIPKILREGLEKVAKHTITEVAPQTFIDNNAASAIERKMKELLPVFYDEALKLVTKRLKRISGTDAAELEGSRPLKQMVKDSIKEDIIESLTGKPIKRKPTDEKTTTSTIKTSKPSTNKSKAKTKPNTAKLISDKPPALRTLSGQFTSTTNLQTLMQQMMHDAVRENMHRPNLEYQTGRFARSVEVKGITRARDGALTAYLSYMRYPYATFERGGAQGHKGYYPSRLILQSARDVAAKLTRERFQAVMVK